MQRRMAQSFAMPLVIFNGQEMIDVPACYVPNDVFKVSH